MIRIFFSLNVRLTDFFAKVELTAKYVSKITVAHILITYQLKLEPFDFIQTVYARTENLYKTVSLKLKDLINIHKMVAQAENDGVKTAPYTIP